MFIAHVRFATNGELLERNTHPFTLQGRIFAHNGVVHGLDAARGPAPPRVPRRRSAGRRPTPSGVFALITQEIDDHGGDVTAGIIAAVRWVAATLPLYAANVVLATPTHVWALRYPDTHDLLWIDER